MQKSLFIFNAAFFCKNIMCGYYIRLKRPIQDRGQRAESMVENGAHMVVGSPLS